MNPNMAHPEDTVPESVTAEKAPCKSKYQLIGKYYQCYFFCVIRHTKKHQEKPR